MKYRSTEETTNKILKVLAQNKEYAQYDLPDAVGKDYRTVLRHLKKLEKDGLVKVDRLEPAQKGGKEKKIYTLTLLGFIAALATCKIEPANPEIDVLIAKFSDLHYIFANWQRMLSQLPRFDVYAALDVTISNFDALRRFRPQDLRENLDKQFTLAFFNLTLTANEKDAKILGTEKWLSYIKSDQPLRELYLQLLTVEKDNLKRRLDFFDSVLKKLR
ncbi:MAG: helix-turn-helix domain-containing protein [Candidatus Bathyarchaeota archaeon]|nr:helix-turn-helix domain-containing protein [Candidatus Bathyarchaeota archaeon]